MNIPSDAKEAQRLMADDPGKLLCPHEPRHHYIGGGMRVCFECMLRPFFSGRGAKP